MANQELVSMKELKAAARRILKPDSNLRMLILSEPDFIPEEQASAKLSVFARLMQQELSPTSNF